MRSLTTFLTLCFGVVVSMLLHLPAGCQSSVFVIDSFQNEYQLTDYLQVLELENDHLTIDQLRSPEWDDRFLPYSEFNKKYLSDTAGGMVLLDASKVYWWRLSLQNNLDQPLRDWMLFTGRSNFTEVSVVSEDGEVSTVHYTGWLTPNAEKDFEYGNRRQERVSFSLPESSVKTLYAKVRTVNQKRPYLEIRLAKDDFYKNWHFVEKTRLDWAFIGFLLTFIFFYFLLYASTSDRVYLWHALFQAGIFLYLLEFFNVLSDLPWLRDHSHALQVFVYCSLCLVDVMYMQFIRKYMGMRVAYPVWDRYFHWYAVGRVVIAVGIITLYLSTFNMKLTDNLTAGFLVGQYSIMVVLIAWLFGIKDIKSKFLMAGTAVFVAGLIMNAFSIIEGAGLQYSYTQLGVMGEVILFTVGLGFRMKYLQKEKQTALRLKDLDEFKSKFYTNITHEFRTPLTVILGMTEQSELEIGKLPEQQSNKSIAKVLKSNFNLIARNADQLLRLTNRLLDLSKLQSGKMTLQMHRGDLADFLRYLVQSFHSFAGGKDIHLRYLSELDGFDMDFDSDKMQDVMSNLLSNAVKFSPPGSEVLVVSKALPPEGLSGEHLQIIVKDNGPGIAADDLPHVFDRFFSAKSMSNSVGSSGIGLALTKELVELMGGKILVKSELGHGASFEVMLPVSRSEPPLERREFENATSEIEAVSSLPVPLTLSNDGEEKPVCLVIDDNADVVKYLQTLLGNEYVVIAAYDGKRGIEKAIELLPDVIISDVMMPEKDGLEVCDFLKNNELTSHIPIILLTAKATLKDRLEGLRRGADAYLQKPFNREELFISLKKSVELRKRLIHHFSKNTTQRTPLIGEHELAIEDLFLQKAKKVVKGNLATDDFDIHRLCRALALSRAQLHRKLTALTGKSTTHFIRSIRLQSAKELLTTTDLTIAEIAYEVGFKDPNYFTRTFTEEFGQSPSETRK